MPTVTAARYQNSVSPAQREAKDGIREMQNRMRLREDDSRFRNWSTDPNIPRHDRTPREAEPSAAPPPRSPAQPSAYQEKEREQAGDKRHEPQPAHGRQWQGGHGRNNYNNYQERRNGRGANPFSNLFGGFSSRQGRNNYRNNPEPEPEPGPQHEAQPRHEPQPESEERKNTTLLQDILGGIGLDDDRILILGLILILINDKADATLILALLYLLL